MVTLDQLNKYCYFLNSSGYEATVENNKIKVTTLIEKYSVVLWCNLGKHFPYELPDIQIDEESYKDLPKMPHTFTNNNICTFDRNLIIPNFEEPEKIIRDVLAKAISIIKDGINGDNLSDYIDEFSEYWSNKSKYEINLFVENTHTFKRLYFCNDKEPMIMSDSIVKLKALYKRLFNRELDRENISESILVPIDKGIPEKIPTEDIDIIDMIKRYSSFYKKYEIYILNHFSKQNTIVFKLDTESGTVLQGWRHKSPTKIQMNGFRPGHYPLKTAFSKDNKNGKAIKVNDCSQNRLYSRGGTGDEIIWNKACIIGCGSVGSYLAEALVSYGVTEFILVDNERLEYENIARHSLGYFYVGKSKVSMLSFSLQLHNPNMCFEEINDNAHSFLDREPEKLNSCDVIFVAVASTAVEYHINKLVLDGIIKVPVIIMWVEPYAIGGHAIMLKDPQNLYGEIFDKHDFSFIDAMVKDSNVHMKREGGCQSSYMPYSGLSVKQFVSRLVDVIATEYWNKKGNYQITWCGKLKYAEGYGIKINENYSGCNEHSLIVKRFD